VKAKDYNGPLRDLIGSYESESKQVVEVALKDGKVSLVVPNQSPYPLEEKEAGKLRSPSLPEAYWVEMERDNAGAVSGIVINQPEGRFSFRRMAAVGALISADELIGKMIAAYGGDANLRKHHSSIMAVSIDMEHQGIRGEGFVYAQSPNKSGTNVKLTALNKEIGDVITYFDGQTGGQLASFAPEETFTGKRLEDLKREASFSGILDWKQLYKTITVKRMAKVGDEDTYVVELAPEKGNKVTVYVSTKSLLVLRTDRVISNENTSLEIPQTELMSDYRLTEGIMVPFRIVSNNIANGDIITVIKDVKFDVEIPESVFKKPVKK
jgi:hypothetical protein